MVSNTYTTHYLPTIIYISISLTLVHQLQKSCRNFTFTVFPLSRSKGTIGRYGWVELVSTSKLFGLRPYTHQREMPTEESAGRCALERRTRMLFVEISNAHMTLQYKFMAVKQWRVLFNTASRKTRGSCFYGTSMYKYTSGNTTEVGNIHTVQGHERQ